MSHMSLQMLTWGTIAGAVASAVLLAVSTDGAFDQFDFGAQPSLSQRAEQRLHDLRPDFGRESLRVSRPSKPASNAASR